jgi:DNA-directed RNA polymerase specialized sigma24 family protein
MDASRKGCERDWAASDGTDGRIEDSRFAAREILLRCTEAVPRLPVELRGVTEACLVGGLTHHQAALATGLPIGTVKSNLRRARALLLELVKWS